VYHDPHSEEEGWTLPASGRFGSHELGHRCPNLKHPSHGMWVILPITELLIDCLQTSTPAVTYQAVRWLIPCIQEKVGSLSSDLLTACH
jgi:hypothetical protein